MFTPTPMPTIEMKDIERAVIAGHVQEFLKKGGEIKVVPTMFRGKKSAKVVSEVEKKSIIYNDRRRAARSKDQVSADNLRFHRG